MQQVHWIVSSPTDLLDWTVNSSFKFIQMSTAGSQEEAN